MPHGQQLIDEINACTVARGECAFWWLGQLGVVVKLGQTVCWIDAYLAESSHRQFPPLVQPSQVTNAALVLGTHDHSDHIDRKSWPTIAAASPGALFVVPDLVRDRVIADLNLPETRVRGLTDGTSVTVGEVTVTGVPASHEFLDQDPTTGRYPYLGYIIEGNGVCIYHAGDTCLYEGMQNRLRRWRLDLAFLPINGRDARRYAGGTIGNMTYQEAVDLAGAIAPGLTVPGHWDMFASNGENPQLFADYMAVKYPALRCLIPVHGQCVRVSAQRRSGSRSG